MIVSMYVVQMIYLRYASKYIQDVHTMLYFNLICYQMEDKKMYMLYFNLILICQMEDKKILHRGKWFVMS